MGYTHYWYTIPNQPLMTTDKWKRFTKDVSALTSAHFSESPPPMARITSETIWIEGTCESFVLRRNDRSPYIDRTAPAPRTAFYRCKTRKEPYDRLVCSVLALAAEYANKGHDKPVIEIFSDGYSADWQPSLDWAATVLKRPVPLPASLRRQ